MSLIKDYNWEVTDSYGNTLEKSKIRELKINKILNGSILEDFIYKITFYNNHHLYLEMAYSNGELSVYNSHSSYNYVDINCKFKIGFEESKFIIDALIKTYDLRICPKYDTARCG